MLSCQEITDLLSAALDGQITPAEQAQLNEHLQHCPACSALFEELQTLHEAAGQLEDLPAPAGFARSVMDRIQAAPVQEQPGNVFPFPNRKRRAPWKTWAVSAAVVAIVALGVFTLPGQFGAGGRAPNKEAAGALTQPDQDHAQDSQHGALADQLNPSLGPSGYCGTLILEGSTLPEGLDAYEYQTDSDGSRIYTVPAEYFLSLVPSDYSNAELIEGSPDASCGLIIVKASS